MKQVLLYDVNVLPQEEMGITGQQVMDFYKEEGIVLWDSRGATPGQDCKPKVMFVPEGTEIHIHDVSTKAGKNKLDQILEQYGSTNQS